MASSGIAVAVIAGNITREPELNESGKVLKLGVAVNRRVKKGEDWDDEVSFFDVKVLGKRAEGLSKILAKGDRVTVEGDLVQERWETDGQNRSAVRILAREVVLGGSGRAASSDEAAGDNTDGW